MADKETLLRQLDADERRLTALLLAPGVPIRTINLGTEQLILIRNFRVFLSNFPDLVSDDKVKFISESVGPFIEALEKSVHRRPTVH